MKWFLALIVALNLFVGAVALLRQHDPVNIHSHEVSPEQIKVLPADWLPPAQASGPASDASAPLTLTQTTASPLGKVAPVASAPASKAPQSASQPQVTKPAAVSKAPQAAKAKANTPAATTKAVSASQPSSHASAAPAQQCAQWGGLNASLLARVQGGLPGLHLAPQQVSVQAMADAPASSGNVRYWVYLPARDASGGVSAALKEKGFDNYAVQNDGEFKGALSLGLFGNQATAQALVDRLKKAGYGKAQLQARGKNALSRLAFKNLSDSQLRSLQALQQRLTPGLPLQTQSCSH